jgi:hypothetical protein
MIVNLHILPNLIFNHIYNKGDRQTRGDKLNKAGVKVADFSWIIYRPCGGPKDGR